MGTYSSQATRSLPTHLQFSEFILSLLPLHPRDVVPIYHEPRHTTYDPAVALIHDAVLSITPTPGVYSKLNDLALGNRRFRPVCFLHRPFNLDRKALPRGVLVQACHKRFDELLTVGWNVALAERLELNTDSAQCIQGYKGDPDRRIGLVAKLNIPSTIGAVSAAILSEFGMADMFPLDPKSDPPTYVEAIAIMNAFGPDEISRAVQTATAAGFISEGCYSKLLYLTGEPKDMGLAAIKENFNGMTTICVGHRPAEEWGIKYLGACLQRRWSNLRMHLVFEEEELPPPPPPKKPKHNGIPLETGK